MNRRMAAMSVAAVSIVLAGCSSRRLEGAGPGVNTAIRMPYSRGTIPAPGLCRIVAGRVERTTQTLARTCDGIENVAPLGSIVLFRPTDVREVHVRYMHQSERGVVSRIDIFDYDTGRLLREVN